MNKLLILGWKEWCALPELGLPAIKVKVDTGAKTSALHTFRIEPFTENGREFVRFWVQRNETLVRECVAPLKDQRMVRDSGGHKEQRYVIETSIQIGDKLRQIEVSLTNRDTMLFRMLLGRRAMQGDTVVNPSTSYINGRLKAKRLYGLV
jgi:hypothetical protein